MAFSELQLLLKYPFEATKPMLVDVGAHQGSVSLPFAQRGWDIVAFEPENKNRAVYLKNTKKFPNVICYDKAVSDVSGCRVPFFVSKEHFGIHSLKPFHKSHFPEYEVETITLDDALAREEVEHVTLLKVDTEGADFLALKGFDFARYKPEVVMVEFMDERSEINFNYTHHDVVSFMHERGYAAFVSEWAPIKEYGREGENGVAHKWLRCVPYPLNHEPSWGNLIFVHVADVVKFTKTLDRYIVYMDSVGPVLEFLKNLIKRVPGVKTLYRLLKRN